MFERRIVELEQQLSQREQQTSSRRKELSQREHQDQKTKASSREKELTSFKLRWSEGKMAPCRMRRYCDAVVDGNTVYVRNGDTVMVYAYDVTSDSWSQLRNCVRESGSLTIIDGLLTTVGGYSYLFSSAYYFNDLFSLTGEGSGRRWTRIFPPMPTKRSNTSALCTGAVLIVAGGRGEGDRVLSTVEVMNTENHQWSTVASLPEPMYLTSAAVCGDQIYMLGGAYNVMSYAKSVYTCSVSALLQSYAQSSLEAKLESTSLVDKASVWRRVADLPVIKSTCESIHGQLLAIGGEDSVKRTTAVYMYNSTTNSWEIISHMTTGRSRCFTAVLPNNQLMVMGGSITLVSITNTVELATLCN